MYDAATVMFRQFVALLLFYNCTCLAQVQSRTDTLPSGELMLVQEVVVNVPPEKIWNAFTREEIWKKWVSPVVEINLKINGSIRSHYNPEAKPGDPGTIVIRILNYIPYKQITMQAELSENFPAFIREEEKNLYSVVTFEKEGNGVTRIIQYGLGYKNEPRWHELLSFFIQANEMSLNQLKQVAEKMWPMR